MIFLLFVLAGLLIFAGLGIPSAPIAAAGFIVLAIGMATDAICIRIRRSGEGVEKAIREAGLPPPRASKPLATTRQQEECE
jgi:hypothetical protein